MCDIFRENYKKCFEEHGARQCRLELDELFNCIYINERYVKRRNYVRGLCPPTTFAILSQSISAPS